MKRPAASSWSSTGDSEKRDLELSSGSTSLETLKTADVTIFSESSLMLFDRDGNVIRKAP